MSAADKMRTICEVQATAPQVLHVRWSTGEEADLNLSAVLKDRAFQALADPAAFRNVQIGDWGHSVAWAAGPELGADALWLETLSALGRSDTRAFLEWRLRNGLSLAKAGEALGVSRRMVAYYSNSEKAVPRTVLLACRGWDADQGGRPRHKAGFRTQAVSIPT